MPSWRFPKASLPRPAALVAGACAGAATSVLALGSLGIPSVALAAALIGAAVPIWVAGERRRAERTRLAAAWPDVLARMRTRVSAGSSLVDALVDGLEGAPDPLARHRGAIDDAVRYGKGFEWALDAMRTDLDDAVADRVLVTIGTAHTSGGRRVGEVLAALAESVADDLRLRAAHDAAMTEQRLTACVALVAPWALLALTVATNEQARVAYLTHNGTIVVALGLLGTGLGYLLARRSSRLSEAPRVFR